MRARALDSVARARCAGFRALFGAMILVGSALLVHGGNSTTTFYVGRHFEVRDHDQPTKYVFSGEMRVAEIMGSLSANQRVQRLRVHPGWNLCSLAVSGPFPASGAETISAAFQWNAGTGDYSQVTFGQTLAAGTALWLKARTNAVVSILGSYSDPARQQVQVGGIFLAGAGLEVWLPALPDWVSSWGFEAATAQWSEHLPGDLATISSPPPILSPGDALYVQAATPASLDIPDPTLRIRYYHQDHLGSSSVITDANGVLVEETAFYPFGIPRNELRPRQAGVPYQFTQKERDQETKLYYFETRYLAGALGRFVTPDLKHACPDRFSHEEFAAYVSTPQKLNLYGYGLDNPMRYIDPLGEDEVKPKSPEPEAPLTLTLHGGGQEMNIAISSWRFGESTPATGAVGAGESQRENKQTYTQFQITRSVDNKGSPELLRMAAGADANGPFEGEITARRTVNGHSEVYMKMKLTSVIISRINFTGQGGDLGTQSFTLNATDYKMEYASAPEPGPTGVGYDLTPPRPPISPVLRSPSPKPEPAWKPTSPLDRAKDYLHSMFFPGRPPEPHGSE